MNDEAKGNELQTHKSSTFSLNFTNKNFYSLMGDGHEVFFSERVIL